MSKDKIATGGPAFPSPHWNDEDLSGMTLRDWFAGQALTGFRELATQTDVHESLGHTDVHSFYWPAHDIAARCYDLADAMIEARNQ